MENKAFVLLNNNLNIDFVPATRKTYDILNPNPRLEFEKFITLRELVTQELKTKNELAKQQGHMFTPGDMINIHKVKLDRNRLKLYYSYDESGYYQHWLTTHNIQVYEFLQKNNLKFYKYSGLSVCILISTADKTLIIGKANPLNSAIFSSKYLNIAGGNLQLKELGKSSTKKLGTTDCEKCAINELFEEYGYKADHLELNPLVFATSDDFKCNPVLTYLVEYPGTFKEFEHQIFLGQIRLTNSEFTKLIPVKFSDITKLVKQENLSYALRISLLAYAQTKLITYNVESTPFAWRKRYEAKTHNK